MKRFLVLYICFCLLFSQNAFFASADVSDVIDEEIVNDENIASTEETLEETEKEPSEDSEENNDSEPPLEKETESTEDEKESETNDVESFIPLKDEKDIVTLELNTGEDNLLEKELLEEDDENDYSIRINEVLPNPEGTDSGAEFIELYNDGDEDVSLENWCLEDKTEKCFTFDNVEIEATSFLTLYNKSDFSFSLNNSDEKIVLKNKDGIVISEFSYKDSSSGESWNYDENEEEWYLESPTPDEKNNENPLAKKYPELLLNEVFPNPEDDEENNEFIEIYNPNDTTIELTDWTLRDASSSGKYIFTQKQIAPKSYFVIYREDFSFALNNSGNETISLIAPNTKTVSSISFTTTKEGLSYNTDTSLWYWEQPTPGKQNMENPLTKEYPTIYLNEILPDPSKDAEVNEFIELYNPFDESVSLKNWQLRDNSQSGHYTFDDVTIESKSYFTIYRSDFSFALNNSTPEKVSLIAPNNKTISSVSYDEARKGISLNRANAWYWAESTPNAKNATDPRTLIYPDLLLSEILPNPSGEESTNEFIEIYNPNTTKVNLKNWTLRDASKTGSYTFTSDIYINPLSFFTVYRKDFSFALNNSDESVSLIAPNEKNISTVTYKSASEDTSYNYNSKSNNWRWSKHITPNKQNVFNNLPQITKFDIDDDSYRDVYTEFEAKATDKDGEDLKVRWDFGDGRKSYLWETRHKYTETGTYHGTLRIQDGSEEVIKNFTIEVKKYPKYKIEIIKIVPNPAGKDSGNEYLIIKNEGKKKIDLKDWSIATGTTEKTIANHPINEKLTIKPGKTKKITRKYAAISLPNKTGVIEIRRPNGSVSDILEYGDKNVSIKQNSSYEKINGSWQWIIPIETKNQQNVQDILAQAIANEEFFSQQLLESKIAFNAIQNIPTGDVSKIESQSQKNILTTMLQNINIFLHKTIITIQNTFHKQDLQKNIAYNYSLKPITLSQAPCDKPFLFTNNKLDDFHFCDK